MQQSFKTSQKEGIYLSFLSELKFMFYNDFANKNEAHFKADNFRIMIFNSFSTMTFG